MGKLGSFIFGGLVGAGVALLVAPRAGAETRSLLASKVEEICSSGQEKYAQGWERAKSEAANVQSTAATVNDELRQKIESARSAIASQVAKNAQAARDAISAQVPVAGEKINQAVDVVRGQIDAAASKLKTATADFAAKDAAAENAAADAAAEVAPVVDVAPAAKEAPASSTVTDKPAN